MSASLFKKLLFLLLLIPALCFAEGISNAPLEVSTQDGTVDTFPYKIKVSDGTLTDNGDGTASLTTGGGGGTPSAPPNSVQFNNGGAFGGSANFIFDGSNTATTDTVQAKSQIDLGVTNPAHLFKDIGNNLVFSDAVSGTKTLASLVAGGTPYTAGGTLLQLVGAEFSVKEGTLTTTKGCKYVAGSGIVCDQDYLTTYNETDPVVKALNGIITSNGSAISAITDNHTNWDNGYTYRVLSASATSPLGLSLTSNVLSGSFNDNNYARRQDYLPYTGATGDLTLATRNISLSTGNIIASSTGGATFDTVQAKSMIDIGSTNQSHIYKNSSNNLVFSDTVTGTKTLAQLVMTYPSSGIALSNGSAWSGSLTDSHTNWDSGYTYRLTSASAVSPLGLSLSSNVLTGSFNDSNYARKQDVVPYSGATGDVALATRNLTMTTGNLTANSLISTVATGTAPLTVTSITRVVNLNADTLDAQHGTYYAIKADTVPYSGATGDLVLATNNLTLTTGNVTISSTGGATANTVNAKTQINIGTSNWANLYKDGSNNLILSDTVTGTKTLAQLANVYPSSGIALSTGSAWGASITDNSANWNTAYSSRITTASATTPLSLSIASNTITAGFNDNNYARRQDYVPYTGATGDLTLATRNISLSTGNIIASSTGSATFDTVNAKTQINLGTSNWANIYKDGSNNLVLSDTVTGTKTLAQLATAGGGANTALSNLISTAINTNLISDTNNADDLGSTNVGWRNIYAASGVTADTVNAKTQLYFGTANQAVINKDASNNLVFSDTVTGTKTLAQLANAGSGANVNLSNLSSTAINTNLISDTDNTDDLGSTAKGWKNIYASSGSTADVLHAKSQIDIGTDNHVAVWKDAANNLVLSDKVTGQRTLAQLASGSMVYPASGIAVSNGSAWISSLTDNHTNWDSGYTYRLTSASAVSPLGLSLASNVLTGSFNDTNYARKQDVVPYTGATGDVALATRNLTLTSGGITSSSGSVSASTLTSTVATGTAPLTVTSTTRVVNLSVDYLDGQHGTYYAIKADTVPYSGSTGDLVMAANNITFTTGNVTHSSTGATTADVVQGKSRIDIGSTTSQIASFYKASSNSNDLILNNANLVLAGGAGATGENVHAKTKIDIGTNRAKFISFYPDKDNNLILNNAPLILSGGSGATAETVHARSRIDIGTNRLKFISFYPDKDNNLILNNANLILAGGSGATCDFVHAEQGIDIGTNRLKFINIYPDKWNNLVLNNASLVLNGGSQATADVVTAKNRFEAFGTGYSVFYGGASFGSASLSARINSSSSGNNGTTVLYIGSYTINTTNPSDIRVKKNIQDTKYSIKDLLKINVKDFKFQQDIINDDDKEHSGIIAQDLENIYPEAVFTRSDNYKAINYDKLIPLLIKSVQDLNAEVEDLKKKIQ